MQKTVEFPVSLGEIDQKSRIKEEAIYRAGWTEHSEEEITLKIVRRSIDARKRPPVYRLRAELYLDEEPPQPDSIASRYQQVGNARELAIIGAGPAGYFAALQCLELGIKPLVFDRGKDVRGRRRDLKAIQQDDFVNPDSNYCFGEGGAGTFSDGKLYTRSGKKDRIEKILRVLVEHGAVEDILVDAHPHIGSNKLPKIVTAIRETIEEHGGAIHFNHRLEDITLDGDEIEQLHFNEGVSYRPEAVLLATGHSARDIFELLFSKSIRIEPKPFAMGVRVEHPQSLIDQIRYGQTPRHVNLPASDYHVTCQVDHRGVYSFCMCPGGLIVPAATSPGEIVVNGMSLSRRDSPYANSGVVVSTEPKDWAERFGTSPLAGMEFQRTVEQRMFEDGDGSQQAPAQRLMDFLEGKPSDDLPDSSYIPGLRSARVDELLPEDLAEKLARGIRGFEDKMKGYLTNEAVVVGTESRSSSPVRIPRNEQLQHVEIENLFPCGEGAGYAGGIVSAALDGERVVGAIEPYYRNGR